MPIVSDQAVRQIEEQIKEEHKPLDEAAIVKKLAQDINVEEKIVMAVLKTLDETHQELTKVFGTDMRITVTGHGIKMYDK